MLLSFWTTPPHWLICYPFLMILPISPVSVLTFIHLPISRLTTLTSRTSRHKRCCRQWSSSWTSNGLYRKKKRKKSSNYLEIYDGKKHAINPIQLSNTLKCHLFSWNTSCTVIGVVDLEWRLFEPPLSYIRISSIPAHIVNFSCNYQLNDSI